jgi:hypothetical protein
VWVPLALLTRKTKYRCIKSTALGTLPLWNSKDPDPNHFEKQNPDPDQNEKQNPDPYKKGLDPQYCLNCWNFFYTVVLVTVSNQVKTVKTAMQENEICIIKILFLMWIV